MKKVLWILFILLIILLIFWWLCHKHLLWFCKNDDNGPAPWQTYIEVSPKYEPADSTQQIIVWRKPGTTDGYLNYWLDSIKKKVAPNDFKITVLCDHCDSSLLLLSGEGIKTFIQSGSGGKGGGSNCTNPPTAGCSAGGPHGGGDTLYWCINFPVEFRDSLNTDSYPNRIRDTTIKPIGVTASTDTAIKVAVFDTGIDSVELTNYLYKSNIESCLGPEANNAWSFITKNKNVNDDYISNVGHGKLVARFIADVVNNYAGNGMNKVKILPVKTHASNGASDLFSVLCGFAYAKERHAKIINASFGYYAVKHGGSATTDPSALLLKQYINYYLTQNNIWLIAAAGNRNSIDNDQSLKDMYIKAGLPIPTDFRNLDQIDFYPASLAADPELPNVIAVTTVDDDLSKVSPNQNYSPTVVDVGVDDDVVPPFGDYWFFNPRMAGSIIKGSSYATPILAGTICAYYDKILNNVPAPYNKDAVLHFLLTVPVGHTNAGLSTKIKSGVLFHKIH